MRLISCTALALAATFITAPTLHAQASISVAAGATLPVGSTADGLEMGYNATLGLGIKPPLAPLGVRFEGMFNSLGHKGASSASTRILAGTANVTLSGVGAPIPMGYLIGGLGMYNSSCSGCAVSVDSETDFGVNIGAGLNIPLTGFGTFVELRYHHIPVEGGSFKLIPITFGMKF